jgi:hypothetical protein
LGDAQQCAGCALTSVGGAHAPVDQVVVCVGGAHAPVDQVVVCVGCWVVHDLQQQQQQQQQQRLLV